MNKFDIYATNLQHRAIAVYLYLYDRKNSKGECWPSVKRISTDLKISKSTVRRAIRDLRQAGLICTEQRYRENGGKSSLLYVLC